MLHAMIRFQREGVCNLFRQNSVIVLLNSWGLTFNFGVDKLLSFAYSNEITVEFPEGCLILSLIST